MSTQATDLTVTKTITVEAPLEHAFAVFTDGIGGWWPLATHSVGRERAEAVALEGRVGGRLFETIEGGEESEWGRIVAWEPPARIVVTWHPGQPAELSTELEVRFTAEGERSTRVDLEHRGWGALGERAAELRDDYDEGWDAVLGEYANAARV